VRAMARASLLALARPLTLTYLLLPTTSATRSCPAAAQVSAATVISAARNRLPRTPIQRLIAQSSRTRTAAPHPANAAAAAADLRTAPVPRGAAIRLFWGGLPVGRTKRLSVRLRSAIPDGK